MKRRDFLKLGIGLAVAAPIAHGLGLPTVAEAAGRYTYEVKRTEPAWWKTCHCGAPAAFYTTVRKDGNLHCGFTACARHIHDVDGFKANFGKGTGSVLWEPDGNSGRWTSTMRVVLSA